MRARVCFFSPKGWGYLRPKQGPDIYFHHSGLVGLQPREVLPDLLVEYDATTRNGRPIAVNIRRPDAGRVGQ
jgi:cold shock CspA family protein